MRTYQNSFALLAVILLVACASGIQAADLTDPYEIFARHYDAIGGLDRVQAEKASYAEAKCAVAGLEGTLTIWRKLPAMERQVLDLGVLVQSGGDNGEYQWAVDANGKVQILSDDATAKKRELRALMADYEHLNRNSKRLALIYEGTETLGDTECLVIKMTSDVTDEPTLTYFNAETFFIERTVDVGAVAETHTTFADHREVDGLWMPFHTEVSVPMTGQTMVIDITKYESNPGLEDDLFDPPGEDKRDFEFTLGNCSEDIPFEFIMNTIFISVNAGGQERLWFLDTGASMSIIDSTFAAELGLAMDGDMQGQGTAGAVSISFVKLPPYSVQGVEFDEQSIGAIDLQALLRKTGLPAVGILGYDFLSRFVTKIDYAARTVSFYDPETFAYEGDGVALEAPLTNNIFSVEATVDGTHSGLWRLDIGSSGLSFRNPYAAEHSLAKRKGIVSSSLGAGGETRRRIVRFDGIELGEFAIADPLIDVPMESGPANHPELIGNIGNTLLRRFVLYLDYANQQIILEKGADFDRRFPRSKSGLQVLHNDHKELRVVQVSDGTPADKAGFEIGDIVRSINGIDISHLNGMKAFSALMRKPAGTKYRIGVQRGNHTKALKLTLKEIY